MKPATAVTTSRVAAITESSVFMVVSKELAFITEVMIGKARRRRCHGRNRARHFRRRRLLGAHWRTYRRLEASTRSRRRRIIFIERPAANGTEFSGNAYARHQ